MLRNLKRFGIVHELIHVHRSQSVSRPREHSNDRVPSRQDFQGLGSNTLEAGVHFNQMCVECDDTHPSAEESRLSPNQMRRRLTSGSMTEENSHT